MRGGGETGGERASVLGEGSLCQEGREDGLHPESLVYSIHAVLKAD